MSLVLINVSSTQDADSYHRNLAYVLPVCDLYTAIQSNIFSFDDAYGTEQALMFPITYTIPKRINTYTIPRLGQIMIRPEIT